MKKVHLTLNLNGIIVFSIKPIKEEDLTVLDDIDDTKFAWSEISDEKERCFYFAQAETPVESYYVTDPKSGKVIETNDNSEDEDEETHVVENEYRLIPKYGISTEEDIQDDYADDEEEMEEVMNRLMNMKFVNAKTDEAKAIVNSWRGLQQNDLNVETFLPAALRNIMSCDNAKKALLKYTSLEDCGGDFSQFCYEIELDDDEDFDIEDLDFINIDAEYEDYSTVLSEHSMDMVGLNAIIYHGKMYFANNIEVVLDNFEDESFDIVDKDIESMN